MSIEKKDDFNSIFLSAHKEVTDIGVTIDEYYDFLKLMDKRIGDSVRFYLLATKLKYKIRSGWDSKHWNVTNERIESIAEHVYGTSILAISLKYGCNLDVDMEKVLKMLAIHEIGEVLIGDITPYDNVTQEEKEKIEHKAMMDVLGEIGGKEELFSLLLEFDRHDTKESKFAYLCDKLEADIQAKVYQDRGEQRSLNDQGNNIVMNFSKIQEIINNGAETVFDVWYESDKSKFVDSPVFARTLELVKDNNTNI